MSGCGPNCPLPVCHPVFFHLCPACQGEGCHACRDNLVYGIVPGEVEGEDSVKVCSEYGDPTMDAAVFGSMDSLISCVSRAREALIADLEAEREAL